MTRSVVFALSLLALGCEPPPAWRISCAFEPPVCCTAGECAHGPDDAGGRWVPACGELGAAADHVLPRVETGALDCQTGEARCADGLRPMCVYLP